MLFRSSVDLRDCPLQPDPIKSLLHALRRAITELNLAPYDISKRHGELKYIIIMANAEMSQAILRFVVRSVDALDRLQQLAPRIQREFPWVRVVSCNLQPIPAAILEGPEEILITSEDCIEERYGSTPLFFNPQSFHPKFIYFDFAVINCLIIFPAVLYFIDILKFAAYPPIAIC